MTEEYTGPKRCDLCKFEKDLPYIGKDCHLGNELQGFRPKGAPVEGESKWSINNFSYDKESDHLTIYLTNEHGDEKFIIISPDELVEFIDNH